MENVRRKKYTPDSEPVIIYKQIGTEEEQEECIKKAFYALFDEVLKQEKEKGGI